MENEKKKRCPYCKEEINAEAKKCRYCGEWLPKTQENAANTNENMVVCENDALSNAKINDSNLDVNNSEQASNFKRSCFYNYFLGGIKRCLNFKGQSLGREFWILLLYYGLIPWFVGSLEDLILYDDPFEYAFDDLETPKFLTVLDEIYAILLLLAMVACLVRVIHRKKAIKLNTEVQLTKFKFNSFDVIIVLVLFLPTVIGIFQLITYLV